MSHFPPNFWSPLAPKLLVRNKKSRWAQKWYGHALSTCQVWWRSAVVEEKMGVFCFVFFCFFCLFVTLTVCVFLGYRHAHCESYIVAIYRSILMQFSAFLEEETLCRIFQKYLNYISRWRHICLGIRSKFEIFQNSNDKVCAHDFDHLGEGWRKIPPQPISPGIVDVHLYKNFWITDFVAAR